MVSKACCTNPLPPAVPAYTPTGSVQKLGSFDVYVTGTGTHFAIAIYDIFGFDVCSLESHTQTFSLFLTLTISNWTVRVENCVFTDYEHAALCGHAGSEGETACVHAGRVPRQAVAPRQVPTEREVRIVLRLSRCAIAAGDLPFYSYL